MNEIARTASPTPSTATAPLSPYAPPSTVSPGSTISSGNSAPQYLTVSPSTTRAPDYLEATEISYTEPADDSGDEDVLEARKAGGRREKSRISRLACSEASKTHTGLGPVTATSGTKQYVCNSSAGRPGNPIGQAFAVIGSFVGSAGGGHKAPGSVANGEDGRASQQ